MNNPMDVGAKNAQKAGKDEHNGKSLIEERRQYDQDTLRRSQLQANPVDQFENWLKQARDERLIDATAMAVTTVDADARPHTRMLLLKHFDTSGFVWFTDQASNKGQQLSANDNACILFFWRELERQVRIEGVVEKLDAGVADEYFYSRPEGSRFSAAASNQSTKVDNRQVLENQVAELHKLHPDGNVPRPERWGGYKLKPEYFEFWQGRNDRLHDRFVYQADYQADGAAESKTRAWSVSRLSP